MFRIRSRAMSRSNVTYNPENPFVFNENYFENITDVGYESANFYLFFHIYFYVCAVLAIFSISMLLYLIIQKTPKSIRPYSKMLLICAITDLYVVFVEVLCQTVSFFTQKIQLVQRVCIQSGVIIFALKGPISFLSYRFQFYIIGWQGTTYQLPILFLPGVASISKLSKFGLLRQSRFL